MPSRWRQCFRKPCASIYPCTPRAGLMQPPQESCSSQAFGSEADPPPRGFLGRFHQQLAQGDVQAVLVGIVAGAPDTHRTDQAAVLPGSLALLTKKQPFLGRDTLAVVAPRRRALDWYFLIRRSLFSLKTSCKAQTIVLYVKGRGALPRDPAVRCANTGPTPREGQPARVFFIVPRFCAPSATQAGGVFLCPLPGRETSNRPRPQFQGTVRARCAAAAPVPSSSQWTPAW